jgi:hypothetical protein
MGTHKREKPSHAMALDRLFLEMKILMASETAAHRLGRLHLFSASLPHCVALEELHVQGHHVVGGDSWRH